MLRYEDHGYCYTWELSLPDGFTLSKPTRYKKRNLYYRDFYLGTYVNEYNLWYKILEMYENPPISIIPAMVSCGQYNPLKATDPATVKELLKAKLVTYEYVYKKFENLRPWLKQYKAKTTVFNNMTYHNTQAGWVDEHGELIDTRKCHFKSTMEARLAYSDHKCTISDVVEFNWGAVLECVGDLCYKLVRFIRLSVAAEAHEEFKRLLAETKRLIEKDNEALAALKNHTLLGDMPLLPDDRIHELYERVEKEIPYNFLLTDYNNRIAVLKGELVIDGCEWISDYMKRVRKQILTEVKTVHPKHVGFVWDKFTQTYSPKYAAPRLDKRHEKLFEELFDQVLYGEISGYEAHLRFVNGSTTAIYYENNRYHHHLTPYVPYYRQRHDKLDCTKYSFTSAVLYVAKCTRELVILGMRKPTDEVTAFNYGEGRYNVNIYTYKVDYRGWRHGDQLKKNVHKMSQEQLDEYMPDRSWQACIIKKVKKYKRQQYLHDQTYRGHEFGDDYNESRAIMYRTLRPPTQFLKAIYAKARSYMAAFKRFKDTILNPVAVAP